MRTLRQLQIDHYGPVIRRRYRSPAGRVRESYLPLFTNYVFVRGDDIARHEAVCSGCVSRCIAVADTAQLVYDLGQIQRLIQTDAPLAPEARLEPGDLVRIRNGRFSGFEGRVIRRQHQTVLIVEVRFMNQGASVALDDCQFDLLSKAATA